MQKITYFRAIGVALAALLLVAPLFAQSEQLQLRDDLAALKEGQEAIQQQMGLQGEIKALQEGQEAIREQLEEIKKLIAARPAAPAAPSGPNVVDVVFDVGNNPVKGVATAQITLLEFTDYQCPYCSRHVRDTHPQIEKEYIDTGKIRYATLDLPLESIHKQAFAAAQAAHCADDQNKYWEMHDRLFENQRAIEPLDGHAEALGIDVEEFGDCMSSEKYAAAVRKDMAEAQKAGASGTPSFVIAKTDPDDPTKVTGVAFLRGAQPFAAFKAQLDQALSAGDE